MGKKGSWISALKRVFTPTSKDNKLVINGLQGPDREFVKEKKKWALGKLKNGGPRPFVHLYREPSSIEQILGDAERDRREPRDQLRSAAGYTTPANAQPEQSVRPPAPAPPERARRPSGTEDDTPRAAATKQSHAKPPATPERGRRRSSTESYTPGRAAPEQRSSPSPAPPRRAQRTRTPTRPGVSPSRAGINHARMSATKIQAAYRGYVARKNYRALRALVRLQGVMRGQSVKRQTASALRLMQLFLRLQSQVRMRRIQAMESKTPQRQTPRISDREQDSSISRWSFSHRSEAEEQRQRDWDSSLLTKDEINVRTQRKVEAITKRERALAYASSHELLKAPPKSPRSALAELRSGRVPVWWSWLEHHLRSQQNAERVTTPPTRARTPTTPRNRAPPNVLTRPSSHNRHSRQGPENPETYTPRSSSGPFLAAATHGIGCNPPPNRAASIRPTPRDDESLTSCPAFTVVPGYMAPTLSARAKVREQAFNQDGLPAETKRRFSFGLNQSMGIGTLRWGKGSLFTPKQTASQPQRTRGKHRPVHSMGDFSVDSVTSLPIGVGRRGFK